MTQAIEFLTDEDDFEKAKKIRERGEIKFKKGEIREAMKDFEVSERIFQNMVKKGEQKRKELSKNCFTFFSLLCS